MKRTNIILETSNLKIGEDLTKIYNRCEVTLLSVIFQSFLGTCNQEDDKKPLTFVFCVTACLYLER